MIGWQEEDMKMKASIIQWLMDGDPAIRWQVQRDLLDNPANIYNTTQQLVAVEGWGSQFLGLQDPGGTWGGGQYGPKWISTTYTLLTLRRLGLHPEVIQAKIGCELLLEGGFQPDGGIHYTRSKFKHSETCITGMVLSILAYFRYPDERIHTLVEHLLGQQMSDGGWNCRSYKGDTHGSFHTTISVLEGLWEYEKTYGGQTAIGNARALAHEFLWIHRLYRSHRTGEVFDPKMIRLPFPPRWRYDYLRSLDYFQDCNAPRDERMAEGIALLRSKCKVDGWWVVNSGMTGLRYFELEKAGRPSRINTLRALRVLRWWEDR
jgi:hypothetical protein